MSRLHSTQASRMESHILIYSLMLITALLVLLTLLWHLSTTNLIERYGMPEEWAQRFLKMQFGEGKAWLWGMVVVIVVVDCLHAVLSLDYHHGCRYERGELGTGCTAATMMAQGSNAQKTMDVSREGTCTPRPHSASTSTAHLPASYDKHSLPLPSKPPRTYHPLHSPLLPPRRRLFLLTFYDTLVVFILAVHIAAFFASFASNLHACNYKSAYPAPFNDPLQTNLSMEQRCWRINIDIHVSGGFDAGLCAFLGALHAWCAAVRVWEWMRHGAVSPSLAGTETRDQKAEPEKASKTCPESKLESGVPAPASPPSSIVKPKCTRGHAWASSAAAVPGDGIRYRDWSREKERGLERMRRQRGSSGSKSENGSWSEMLLECLVP